MSAPRILLIEDEKKVALMVKEYLELKGFVCQIAQNGQEGLLWLSKQSVDLVLLDWMLPGGSGIEVAKKIQSLSRVPIIMLTAKDAEEDMILGLESGADDYLTKPFSLKELTARISAHLRRRKKEKTSQPSDDWLIHGSFRLNLKTRKAWKNQQELDLTALRFNLLVLFLENPGQVFTREQIMEHLSRDVFYDGLDRTIDAHIKNLRKIIEKQPSAPCFIITVRGVGYKFEETEK